MQWVALHYSHTPGRVLCRVQTCNSLMPGNFPDVQYPRWCPARQQRCNPCTGATDVAIAANIDCGLSCTQGKLCTPATHAPHEDKDCHLGDGTQGLLMGSLPCRANTCIMCTASA